MNIGDFIKVLSIAIFAITVIILLFFGIPAMNDYRSTLTLGTWLTLLISSGISTVISYAFGTVVEKVHSIEETLRYLVHYKIETTTWKCKKCGGENPNSIGRCQSCGELK